MADIFPIGTSRGGPDSGQAVPLSSDNAAVDTADNTLQFASPRGFTGIIGLTGLENTSPGITGIMFQGASGIPGVTGIPGSTGGQGVVGLTGFIGLRGGSGGVTGLQGVTGIQSFTGLLGDTGFRGLTGVGGLAGATGIELQGVTGLTGGGETGIIGSTGIIGETGIITAMSGATGLAITGVTGLQGVTGLVGATGLSGNNAIDIFIGQGIELISVIPANTLTSNNQQVQFRGAGLTSDTDVGTTVTLELGATTFLTIVTGSIADSFVVEGLIVRTGASAQAIVAQVIFDSGLSYTVSTTAAQSWASDLNLTLSVSASAGDYSLTELSTYLIN